MKELHKNLRIMFWLMALLFIALGGYFVYVAAFEASDFIANPRNPRVAMVNDDMRRGTIYDTNGTPIAESIFDEDSGLYTRQYHFGAAFAHTVGYSGMSKAGLELSRNFTLYHLNRELVQRATYVIMGQELRANSIITTFDADLQQMIFNSLGDSRGAVVVLNPTTGAVLAMVSTPSFDPNNVTEQWGNLIADTSNSPLLNRAAQGLYPPGSTFKVVTAVAALETSSHWLDFVFECTGHAHFDGETIQCWGGQAHGLVDMHRAMAVSCNGFFAKITEEIGARPIIDAAEQMLFNSGIEFELVVSMPQFPMGEHPAIDELIQTAIGQGRTTATPLNMALIAAAIANGGIVMTPYIVDGTLSGFGNVSGATSPQSMMQIMDAQMAARLNEMLIEVVNTGTGTPAALSHIQVAGKTGTAQNETGIDHSWFIGYAPAENPTVALAIIIENTGGGTRATQLAGQIFNFAID
ncbi:MAG: penicillin-binding transpeptidase domain-containing protein [Defluviitaleaceae bacterium]|nr:penicillin-binding transpeptidase domain-containing protein [Defluviitaleaceae bacterium]